MWTDSQVQARTGNPGPTFYDEFNEFRQGSTRIALEIDDKPFDRLIFIDKDSSRMAAEALLNLKSEHPGRHIEVLQGDANDKVPEFAAEHGQTLTERLPSATHLRHSFHGQPADDCEN